MNHKIIAAISAALILTGCTNTNSDSGTGKDMTQSITETQETQQSKKIEKLEKSPTIDSFRKLHDSENRNIIISLHTYSGGCIEYYQSYSLSYNVYNDSTVEICCNSSSKDNFSYIQTFNISEKDYLNILDVIDDTELDRIIEVELDTDACDAPSNTLIYYDESGIYNSNGGYCVQNKDFFNLSHSISDLVSSEEINKIRDHFEKDFQEYLSTK